MWCVVRAVRVHVVVCGAVVGCVDYDGVRVCCVGVVGDDCCGAVVIIVTAGCVCVNVVVGVVVVVFGECVRRYRCVC